MLRACITPVNIGFVVNETTDRFVNSKKSLTNLNATTQVDLDTIFIHKFPHIHTKNVAWKYFM